MEVEYSDSQLTITYGTTTTLTPTINVDGGTFSLSQNIDNVFIDSSSGIITFSNPIPVNVYNFDIVYTTTQDTIINFTLTVTPKDLICIGVDKEYDGTNSATVTLSGIINGDSVSEPLFCTFIDKNIGTNKTISISGVLGGNDSGNYNLLLTDASANITPLDIICVGDNKVYDGTINATVTLEGIILNDDVSYYGALFSDKDVSDNKIITLSGSLIGDDSNNYNLTTINTTANITQLDITCTGNNKVYDRTTLASVSLVGVLADDDVTPPTLCKFVYKDVANNNTITISGFLGGVDANNYNLTSTTVSGIIQKLNITCTGNNKVYDKTTSATVTLSGIISGDTVLPPNLCSFSDKNVGEGKTITISGNLSGSDSGNYNLTDTTATANITPKEITCIGQTKTYDSTTSATVRLIGLYTNDFVDPPTSCTFDTKNVGTNKTITVSGNLGNTDRLNYRLITNSTTAGITQTNLTCVGVNRYYDGTTTATVTLSGVFSGDIVTPPTLCTFSDKKYNINQKNINVSGGLGGNDASNYKITSTTNVKAYIYKLPISCTGNNKVYDRSTTASVTLSGVISGDIVSPPACSFSDRYVGDNKNISITGPIGGTDGSNYSLTAGTIQANITKLDITCTGNDKIYDGTTTATVRLNNIINGDVVSPPTSCTFDNKNYGNRTITISGDLNGVDRANYRLITTSTSANITKLNITCDGINKTYDGNTSARVRLNNILSGDSVSSPLFCTFDNKNYGTNKTVTISGDLGGTDGNNYRLTTTTARANIDKLNITCNGNNKVYNRNNSANVTLSGVISGDFVSAPLSCTFSDKNYGIAKTITIAGVLGDVDANNYNLTTTSTTANINRLNITCDGDNKIYDGTNSATVKLSGVISGDFVSAPLFCTFSDKNYGIGKTITVSGVLGDADADNYSLTTTSTTANINKLDITCIGNDKTYDGTLSASVTLVDVLSGDSVSAPTSCTFDNKNYGTRNINVIGSISGTDAVNYRLTTTSTTANIRRCYITCSGNNKVYDGNVSASVTLSGVISGDNVSPPVSCTFPDKNIGEDKIITVTGSLSGSDSNNYNLTSTNARANITKLDITCNGNNKTYDGTRSASVTLVGVLLGDSVSAPNSCTFDNKNYGNRTITVSGGISGSDSSNYNLTTTSVNANIAKLNITCNGNNKIYDGTRSASISLVGVISGDSVSAPNTCTFSDKNVGDNKIITITGSISGSDSGNYILSSPSATANITKLDITCEGNNKVYDRTTSATVSLVGVVAGDSVSAPASCTFVDRNVGEDKTITVVGSISGDDSGNYNLTTISTRANITKLNITCNGNNKVYNGTTAANVSLVGIILGDSVYPPASCTFSDKNVGDDKTITVAGFISGSNSGNYNLTSTTARANITKLDITCEGNNKVYDRTTSATVSLVGLITNDSVLPPASCTFADINVGDGKTITVTGSISGDDSGNYRLTTTSTRANITKRDITCTGNNKIYDRTTSANVSLVGVITGDSVSPPASCTFADKNVGDDKSITVAGSISGSNSGNYNLTSTSARANITKLDITCEGINKVYDRSVSAAVSLVGVILGDTVSAPNSCTFSDKTVGDNKTVTVAGSLSGTDSGNYNLTTTSTRANITKLNITCNGNNKVYNGTTAAFVSLVGIISGDTVSPPDSCTFSDKNVGVNKIITVSGSISGTDSINYNLTSTSARANITVLNIICVGNNKVYDRNTSASVSLVGIISGDSVSAPTSCTFDDKNVGTSKNITVSGLLSGTDSGNYYLTNSSTSANITKFDITCTGNNKVYDRSVSANVSLVGVLGGDNVVPPNSCTFDNKNVGDGKTITVTGLLSGNDGGNYNLTTLTTRANITKLDITCTGNNKVYDRTTSATVSLVGIISGDSVSAPTSNTFSDRNVGDNKTITVAGSISGNDSGNYNLTTTSTRANITKLNITCTGNNKVYDRNLSATVTLVGVIVGDSVSAPTSCTFSDRNVGDNKNITITGSISGTDSGNYNLTSTSTRANITKLNITCTGNNRQYNRTVVATVTLVGVISGDNVNPPTASFDTAELGTNKIVTITGTISGTDSGNYNLTTTITNANITQALLTITFDTPKKEHDGSTSVQLILTSINGIIGDDNIYLNSYNAHFSDTLPGYNKTVLVTNINLVGENILYYTYSTSMTLTGGTIYLINTNIFINQPLYIDQNANAYTQYMNEQNMNYDYILTVHLGSLPGINNNITNIFKSATYIQNSLNVEAYNTNMNILPSNQLVDFTFEWSDVNQANLSSISMGRSTVAFNTFDRENIKFGDRMLEIVAHKLFGHAQARAAINNDTEFYSHDYQIWDHLSNSIANNQLQNDIMNQYISSGRILQNPNNYNNNILTQADALTNVQFNFSGMSFDYLLYINGSMLLNNTLTDTERALLSNGPNVGGTSLINGAYNIPILLKFSA